MGFLKGLLGAGGLAAGGGGGAKVAGMAGGLGGNFLAKLFGGSPEKIASIADRIGTGANQIAQAGGAEAGYQSPMQQTEQPQMYSGEGLNNFLAQIMQQRQQMQQPGREPQNMSWYR